MAVFHLSTRRARIVVAALSLFLSCLLVDSRAIAAPSTVVLTGEKLDRLISKTVISPQHTPAKPEFSSPVVEEDLRLTIDGRDFALELSDILAPGMRSEVVTENGPEAVSSKNRAVHYKALAADGTALRLSFIIDGSDNVEAHGAVINSRGGMVKRISRAEYRPGWEERSERSLVLLVEDSPRTVLDEASDVGGLCGTPTRPDDQVPFSPSGESPQSPANTLFVIEVATEADYSFFGVHSHASNSVIQSY